MWEKSVGEKMNERLQYAVNVGLTCTLAALAAPFVLESFGIRRHTDNGVGSDSSLNSVSNQRSEGIQSGNNIENFVSRATLEKTNLRVGDVRLTCDSLRSALSSGDETLFFLGTVYTSASDYGVATCGSISVHYNGTRCAYSCLTNNPN